MARIKVATVGDAKTPGKKLERDLEAECQRQVDQGRTLRSAVSRGGAVYLVFAEKVKG